MLPPRPGSHLAPAVKQVDFTAGTVRLEPGTTKTDEGRMFVMTPTLRATLEAQKAIADKLQSPYVFTRRGKPIRNFRHAWDGALKRVGLSNRVPHDFRRTAVRNLERAGVPRSVAMKMVGQRTEAMYQRYAIVDETQLGEGGSQAGDVGTGSRAQYRAQ